MHAGAGGGRVEDTFSVTLCALNNEIGGLRVALACKNLLCYYYFIETNRNISARTSSTGAVQEPEMIDHL